MEYHKEEYCLHRYLRYAGWSLFIVKIRACKIYHIDNVSINHVFYADDLCLMAHCAIALQELITVCYQYSNKIDLNFNSTKSICFAFTINYYILSLSPLFMNSLSLLYADTIKYF